MSTDLALGQELHSGRGGVMAYVSPSRLNCWLSCPWKFKLQYVDGLRLPTTPALFLGKIVHASLEIFYRHRQLGIQLGPDDLVRRLLEDWSQTVDDEGMRFQSAAEEQQLQEQARRLVSAYLEQFGNEDSRPRAVETAVEAPLFDPFTGENLGLPLLGVMDLVLDEKQGPVIVDFKTSARGSEPLEIVHEVQLSCYAWLFRQVSGEEEAGLEIRSLVKTKAPRTEVHDYPARTERHFQRLFAIVRAYLDNLDSGRFLIRPGFGCGMCDFRQGPCAAWCGP